jgi:hypothetical protein
MSGRLLVEWSEGFQQELLQRFQKGRAVFAKVCKRRFGRKAAECFSEAIERLAAKTSSKKKSASY